MAEEKPAHEKIIWINDFKQNKRNLILKVSCLRNLLSNKIKIYMDTSIIRGWNGIDTVGIACKSGRLFWPIISKVSSERRPYSVIKIDKLKNAILNPTFFDKHIIKEHYIDTNDINLFRIDVANIFDICC